MVSFVTMGRTFFPCLFLDTALATQQLEACEGLCLAESWLCLSPDIPTACSLGIVLGNREAALFQGHQVHQSLLMLTPGLTAFSDVLPAQLLASQIS